jgi:hypothetical protein
MARRPPHDAQDQGRKEEEMNTELRLVYQKVEELRAQLDAKDAEIAKLTKLCDDQQQQLTGTTVAEFGKFTNDLYWAKKHLSECAAGPWQRGEPSTDLRYILFIDYLVLPRALHWDDEDEVWKDLYGTIFNPSERPWAELRMPEVTDGEKA